MPTRQRCKRYPCRGERIAAKTFSAGEAGITLLSFNIQPSAFRAQLLEVLAECDRHFGLTHVARQTFFLSQAVDRSELIPVIEGAYGGSMPVTSYVHQPPAEGHALSCELWAFSPDVELQRGQHVTTAGTRSGTWGFVGGVEIGETEPPGTGLSRILNEAQRELHRSGLTLEQTVRTWYYIGNILGSGEKETTYDRFNVARNEFYRDIWPDLCRTPASTGIGMGTNRIAFEGLVFNAEGNGSQVSWIDNPLQKRPFLYENHAQAGCNPSFSRAAAVRFAETTVVFISGTASIRGSEILSPGDPEAQTRIAIENIASLIGVDNLSGNHGFSRGGTLDDLQGFRIYLKRPGDLEVVRDCCRRYLPPVPHTFLIADVCRSGFLVEIEGVAAFANDE